MAFDDFPSSQVEDRGHFFKLNKVDFYESIKDIHKNTFDINEFNKVELHNPLRATLEEIAESNTWVLPGSLSTSRYCMSVMLNDINKYFKRSKYYFDKGLD